jgi:hypothetical protein
MMKAVAASIFFEGRIFGADFEMYHIRPIIRAVTREFVASGIPMPTSTSGTMTGGAIGFVEFNVIKMPAPAKAHAVEKVSDRRMMKKSSRHLPSDVNDISSGRIMMM